MTDVSARIHVLLARDAPLAVVIRRGPSKHVATVGWNRDTDSFTLGQWFKGRIYERRSDLSPDGKFLIYFAKNCKWRSETKASWTAISRAPFLKAVGLWAKGDCWHGGGLFVDAKLYWINDGYGHQALRIPAGFTRDQSQPAGRIGGECLGVYFPRLLRDGWRLTCEELGKKASSTSYWQFDKPAFHGWTLRKRAIATLDHPPGKGCYFDEHELINEAAGAFIDSSAWEWAEIDRQRLVWSESGRLFAAILDATGLTEVHELYDFNPMRFEPVEAPY